MFGFVIRNNFWNDTKKFDTLKSYITLVIIDRKNLLRKKKKYDKNDSADNDNDNGGGDNDYGNDDIIVGEYLKYIKMCKTFNQCICLEGK